MTEEKSGAVPIVRVKRELPAAPEAVFDAWTDVESLRRWMCPGGTRVSAAELDPRVGGRFRIVMSDEASDYEHLGEYLEIERPRRLVFTWRSPATEDRETRVTVMLRPSGEGTELELLHERLPDEGSARRHHEGWADIAEKLEVALS